MHPTNNIVIHIKMLIKTLFIVGLLFFQTELSGQKIGWFKINSTPFMLSQSPFDNHSDCSGQTQVGHIPNNFYEHILLDSLFISKDFKQVKLVLRYFGNLKQIDTNDLRNYKQLDTFQFSLHDKSIEKYKKVGDSLYLFNFYLLGSHENLADSIVLYNAINVQNKNNCDDNFPFGSCWNGFKLKKGALICSKYGKSKTVYFQDCYKITEVKKLKNDAKQFSITVPLQHSFLGSGRPYVELHEYLKSWDTSLNIFLKPFTGSYDSKNKLWELEYDTSNNSTNAAISIFNGGTDTLFISRCVTTAGYATILSFPKIVAPASWGTIQLQVNNLNRKPNQSNTSTFWMKLLDKESNERYKYYTILYHIK